MNRPLALLAVGSNAVVAAVAVFVAFVLAQFDGFTRVVVVIAAVVAVGALLVAVRFAVRPPVVLTLDEQGFRGRARSAGGRFTGRWTDVEDVTLGAELLTVDLGSGRVLHLPLRLVEPARRPDLFRDIQERLNAAHGYRRFSLE